MKIVINAQQSLYDLTGDPIKERMCMHCGGALAGSGGQQPLYTIGKAIADTLLRPNPQAAMNAMKALELARKFYNNREVEIESADLKDVKNEIEKEKATSPLVRGQVLEYLESLKTSEGDKEKGKKENLDKPAPTPTT